MLASSITSITDHINTLKYLPTQDSPKRQDHTTVVPDNRRDPPLYSEQSTKIGDMWILKHDFISPKFYELLINTWLKIDTALDIKNFYNHIKMCVNAVNIIREDFLPDYQSIKRHSEFAEYFIPDRDHPSYSWNVEIYTSLGHSLLVAMNNFTCIKPSMSPQAYNIVITHVHEISGCTIQSRIIHLCTPNIEGMKGWYSVWPDHPAVQEQRTTWRFL